MDAPTTRMPVQSLSPWTPPVRIRDSRAPRHPLAALAVVIALVSGLTIGSVLQAKTPDAGPAALSVPQPVPTAVLPSDMPLPGVEVLPPDGNQLPPAGRAPAGQPPAAPAPAAPASAAPAPAPPSIAGQVAYPNPMHTAGCSGEKAGVIAKITSDGEPRAVALFSRSPAGAGSAVPMVKIGEGWVATLGPYPTTGTVTWAVGVTDAHGMTVTGPVSSLPVLACAPK